MSAEKVLELHFGSDFWLLGDKTTEHILNAMEEFAKQEVRKKCAVYELEIETVENRERKLYEALEFIIEKAEAKLNKDETLVSYSPNGIGFALIKAIKTLNECKPNEEMD